MFPANFYAQSLPQRLQESRSVTALTGLGFSASSLVQPGKQFASSCEPLDELLDGGLAFGQILEISGPPGAPREQLSSLFAKEASMRGQEVLYVGPYPIPSTSRLH